MCIAPQPKMPTVEATKYQKSKEPTMREASQTTQKRGRRGTILAPLDYSNSNQAPMQKTILGG